MIPLGFGQVVLGGFYPNIVADSNMLQDKIYHITCYDQNCMVSLMNQKLSVPRGYFVAIPMPDSMSECTSESKFGF